MRGQVSGQIWGFFPDLGSGNWRVGPVAGAAFELQGGSPPNRGVADCQGLGGQVAEPTLRGSLRFLRGDIVPVAQQGRSENGEAKR